MKMITRAALAVAMAFGISAPASALVLSAGDLKFTFNAFDSGTYNYGSTAGIKCTTVAGCDSVAGIVKAKGAIGSEDTWGIFSIQSVTSLATGQAIFVAGQNGEYLTGMFGGIKDTLVEVAGIASPQTTVLGTGGWLNMYLTNTNYNSSFGIAGRQGEFGYKGITNVGGTLALAATFGGGVLGGSNQYTYLSSFANQTIGGYSQGYLDVIGGAWQNLFDTNSQVDLNGNKHDLYLKTTFSQNTANGWLVNASGDVQPANKVPEPGSLALLGLGLAGLALLRSRRA